jgi:hypothetical protein
MISRRMCIFKDDYETWQDLGTDGTYNLHISEFSKHQIGEGKSRGAYQENFLVCL